MNNTSFKRFTSTLEYIIKYFKAILVFTFGIVIVSGIYTVESHEVAVVLRFGRLVGNTPSQQIREPGIHFALPFFIDQVVRIPVHTIHEQELVTHYSFGQISPFVEHSGYVITGDNNIMLLRATLRYQISDPIQYALFNYDPSTIINSIVSSQITRIIANIEIDTALTTARGGLGQQILQSSQATLNELNIGTQLISLELTDISPPAELSIYFEAVRSASITKETSIQQALEQSQAILLEASASSNSIMQSAIADQNFRTSEVYSKIAEFDGLHDQDPSIIYSGFFRQRIGGLLANSGNTIIVPDNATPPMIILP
jgi:membrane protease subunit HflK